MNREIEIRAEWSRIGLATVLVAALGVFAWLAMASIWYYFPTDEQREVSFLILLQESARTVPWLFGVFLVYVFGVAIWHRVNSWIILDGELVVRFAGKPVRSIPLGEIESLSFRNWSLTAYWRDFHCWTGVAFVSKETARRVTDIWVQERARHARRETERPPGEEL